MYRLVTAAARDPLAIYYEVDRLIERATSQFKGAGREYHAMELSAKTASLIEALLEGRKKQA
jgi:hypothetical protein